MTEQEITAALTRIHGADDPWNELMVWLKEQSAISQTVGASDESFISLIVMWVMQLSPPAKN